MTAEMGAAPAAGDVLALYGEYAPAMLRFVLAVTGDEALARDAVREAFLELLGSQRAAPPPAGVRESLFRSVRTAVERRAGDRESGRAPLGSAARIAALEASPADAKEALPQILIRLASPREREILHLRSEGLSYAEIASVLGISSGTVGSMLARVARKLHALERRQGRP